MCVNRHVTIIYFGVLREHQHCTAPPPHCCVNLKPPSEREEETRLREDFFFLKRRNGDNTKKNTHIFWRRTRKHLLPRYYSTVGLCLISNSFLKRDWGIRTCLSEFSRIFFSCCFIFWPRRRKATLIDDKKVLFFSFFSFFLFDRQTEEIRQLFMGYGIDNLLKKLTPLFLRNDFVALLFDKLTVVLGFAPRVVNSKSLLINSFDPFHVTDCSCHSDLNISLRFKKFRFLSFSGRQF